MKLRWGWAAEGLIIPLPIVSQSPEPSARLNRTNFTTEELRSRSSCWYGGVFCIQGQGKGRTLITRGWLPILVFCFCSYFCDYWIIFCLPEVPGNHNWPQQHLWWSSHWSQKLLHFTVTTVSSPLKYALHAAGALRKALLCVSGAIPARWHRLAETVRTGWGPASCKECNSCHLMSWPWLPGRLCCVAKARIAILGFMTPLSRNRGIRSVDHLFKGHHLGLT